MTWNARGQTGGQQQLTDGCEHGNESPCLDWAAVGSSRRNLLRAVE
jgi:hypothetical protein